mgnify:FL=1
MSGTGPLRWLFHSVVGAIGALAVTMAAGLGGSPAEAVTRTCNAEYFIGAGIPGGVQIRREFSVEGTASNPNAARRVARAFLEGCVLQHWQQRAADERPQICRYSEFNRYPFDAFEAEITELICAANPGHPDLDISVWLEIRGNTGCIPHNRYRIVLASDYRVACPDEFAYRGVVPLGPPLPDTRLPGNDLRQIDLPEPDWRLCSRACEDEPECRAWTYREPTPTHVPLCLLKRAAGVHVTDTCCASGIKD